MIPPLVRRLVDWLVWDEGSTRPAALLRIALALLLWDRWARDFLLFRIEAPVDFAIALSFYVATSLLLVGLWTRVAVVWTAITMLVVFFYQGVFQRVEAYTHHHTWLLVCMSVLLVFTPCERSFSVDRWRALRRAESGGAPCPPERGPLWGLRLLAMQTSVVYLGATFDKLTWPFLSGVRLQHLYIDRYGTADPITMPGFDAIFCALAIGTVVIELALGVGLWIPRVRGPLVIVGLVFHGILFITLPVGPFSATMAALYISFFDPDAVHRVIERLVGRAVREEDGAAA
ncbi:MAG: HTTM domain-containing protein [Pseudomonadota bacterium]|nr:HTTM domain-containing protein [Pseudomonadota bacterium]